MAGSLDATHQDILEKLVLQSLGFSTMANVSSAGSKLKVRGTSSGEYQHSGDLSLTCAQTWSLNISGLPSSSLHALLLCGLSLKLYHLEAMNLNLGVCYDHSAALLRKYITEPNALWSVLPPAVSCKVLFLVPSFSEFCWVKSTKVMRIIDSKNTELYIHCVF